MTDANETNAKAKLFRVNDRVIRPRDYPMTDEEMAPLWAWVEGVFTDRVFLKPILATTAPFWDVARDYVLLSEAPRYPFGIGDAVTCHNEQERGIVTAIEYGRVTICYGGYNRPADWSVVKLATPFRVGQAVRARPGVFVTGRPNDRWTVKITGDSAFFASSPDGDRWFAYAHFEPAVATPETPVAPKPTGPDQATDFGVGDIVDSSETTGPRRVANRDGDRVILGEGTGLSWKSVAISVKAHNVRLHTKFRVGQMVRGSSGKRWQVMETALRAFRALDQATDSSVWLDYVECEAEPEEATPAPHPFRVGQIVQCESSKLTLKVVSVDSAYFFKGVIVRDGEVVNDGLVYTGRNRDYVVVGDSVPVPGGGDLSFLAIPSWQEIRTEPVQGTDFEVGRRLQLDQHLEIMPKHTPLAALAHAIELPCAIEYERWVWKRHVPGGKVSVDAILGDSDGQDYLVVFSAPGGVEFHARVQTAAGVRGLAHARLMTMDQRHGRPGPQAQRRLKGLRAIANREDA